MKFTTALHPDKPVMHIPFIDFADFKIEGEASYIALAENKDGFKTLVHLVALEDNDEPKLQCFDYAGTEYSFDDLGIAKILKICDLLEINDNKLLPANTNPAESNSEWMKPEKLRANTEIQGETWVLGWAWVLMAKQVHDFDMNDEGKLVDAGGTDEYEYSIRLAKVETDVSEHDHKSVCFILNISASDSLYPERYEESDHNHIDKLGSIVAFDFISPNLL